MVNLHDYLTEFSKTIIRPSTFLKGFRLDYRKGLIISFAFGFVLRLIPEVLSYPYPIGFDTVREAARMKYGVIWPNWTSVFSTWLLYAILIPLHQIVKGDPFLLLKFVTPVLYALNVCGVYYFSRRALGWDVQKGLIAAFFFAFQLASLRLSWDLQRNVLGMAALLFALPLIQKLETKQGFALFLLLSMLVVLSHEYASVVMFAVVLWVTRDMFLKVERRRMLRVFAAVSPALAFFLTSICLRMLYPEMFSPWLPLEANVIRTQQLATPGGVFFLIDYLSSSLSSIHYATYVDLVSHFFSLFAVLFSLCLPLVLIGFFKEKLLNGWTLLLLIGTFSSLIIPFAALIWWDRWMIMLTYPFTFYAVNGIQRVLHSKTESVRPSFRWMHWMKVSKRTALGILFLTVVLGSLLMSVRFREYGVFSIPTTSMYLPSTMLQNTVPLQDVRGIVEAFEWFNSMDDASGVLVHHAFLSWATLYLDKKNMIFHFRANIDTALNVALEHGFSSVYLVWWNNDAEFYGLTVPEDFVAVFNRGRISVFEYVQQHQV